MVACPSCCWWLPALGVLDVRDVATIWQPGAGCSDDVATGCGMQTVFLGCGMQVLVHRMYRSDYGINNHGHKEVEQGLPHPVVIVELGSGDLPELLLVVTYPGCWCRCPGGAAAPAASHIPELMKSATTPTCLCRPSLQPADVGYGQHGRSGDGACQEGSTAAGSSVTRPFWLWRCCCC